MKKTHKQSNVMSMLSGLTDDISTVGSFKS